MKKNNHTAKAFKEIADRYESEFFKQFPEQAQFWGRADGRVDQFNDHSLSAIVNWQSTEDRFLTELQSLKAHDFEGAPEFISFHLLKETLLKRKKARICKVHLWSVNPLGGWHNELTSLAENQPVGTLEFREAALRRWRTVGGVVDAEIEALKVGLKEGYVAPKVAVQRVLKQISLILNVSVENSPFFVFAKKDGDPEFKAEMRELIKDSIQPALKRYADYLEQNYISQARDVVGVSALPAGKECYAAKVEEESTLEISPQAIFDFGHAHMESLTREIGEIGKRLWGVEGNNLVFQTAKKKTQGFFHSEQEILAYNLDALQRAQNKIPEVFISAPKARGELKPYPLHQAQTGAPGEYHPPAEDGSRPGVFYINTFQPQKRSRVDQEATLFHELIPGHHFQIALAMETPTGHSLDKYLWNSGYGEGWALYVERLADELGLYQDDISRLGMLSNEALRTARLVVDPGLHVLGWSRDQAIQYLKQNTALDEAIIEGEVDRYIMNPGQATSYFLGKREIERLRDLAQSKLGVKFDIKEFHHQVLKNGAVTLPMLNEQIQRYIQINS